MINVARGDLHLRHNYEKCHYWSGVEWQMLLPSLTSWLRLFFVVGFFCPKCTFISVISVFIVAGLQLAASEFY